MHGSEDSDADVLAESTHPPEGITYAASFPGVDLVCDRRLMFYRPSELPAYLLKAAAGRRVILHAMHSVSDWLAFAVWEEGRLRRSLSLSPDGGIVENVGDPLPFEAPYWAGDRAMEDYALPFHPWTWATKPSDPSSVSCWRAASRPRTSTRTRSLCWASPALARMRSAARGQAAEVPLQRWAPAANTIGSIPLFGGNPLL